MNKLYCLMLGLGLNLILTSPPPVMAKEQDKKPKHKHKNKSHLEEDKEPWACVKNGKIIAVKGKNDEQKQDRCQEQFGIWEKKRHAVERTQ